MPELLQNFIYNSFWAKALVAVVLFLYLLKLGKDSSIAVLPSFRLLVPVLLATDFALALLPHFVIFPVFQALAVQLVYYQVLGRVTGKARYPLVFWLFGGVSLLVAGASSLADLPWFASLLFPLVSLGLWINFGAQLYGVTEYNTENSLEIRLARRNLVQIQIGVTSLVLILTPWGGYLNPIVQMLVLPGSYLIHLLTLNRWEQGQQVASTHHVEALEKNLGSLFEFMIAIGNAISEKLEIDKVLEFVVRSAVKATAADGGAIFLVDEFEDVLRVKAVEGDFPPPYAVPAKVKAKITSLSEYFVSTPIPLNKTIVGECAMGRKGVYIRDTRLDPRMAQNAALDQLHISSIILVPLMQGTKVFGVLAIVSRRGNFQFTVDHYSQIKTFADYTSLTINSLFTYLQLLEKQEMEKEVGIAAEIQGQLLPGSLPRVSSVSLAAFSQPAKGVSGDYYDIISIRKGHIMLAVCDVAGKGIPASLVMVMIRTIIHLVAHQPGMHVSRILDVVNWGIAGKVSLDRFATVALLTYDFAQHKLEYSNAAHHPLLIYRAVSRSFETFDTEGIPIGLEKKTRYEQVETQLGKGDIVILYTDGIIEAMNEKGMQYTYESLQSVVEKNCEKAPEALKRAIIEDVNAFVGKARQHDDQTFVLMKVEN